MKISLRYIVFVLCAVVILLEIGLRIYNPFPFRIKGDRIILEANKKYVVDNSRIPVLDPVTTHTKNNLGFRGPDLPADTHNLTKIITIGGSTTECFYLDDAKTWSHLLYLQLKQVTPSIWLNNAGLAGHSTYGNLILLKDHVVPLHPDIVIILAGANDIRRGLEENKRHAVTAFLLRHSEVCKLLLNISRAREAKKRNLTDTYIDLRKADTLNLTGAEISNYVASESTWVNGYKKRLQQIIEMCRSNKITPVFVTQPSLVGAGTDPVTGVSMETIKLKEKENGKVWWTMLEKYNDGMRKIAQENNVPLIDLAHQLPHSSKYFYDIVHFTNDGAAATARVIYDSLLPIVLNR